MTENPYLAPQTPPQNITAQASPEYVELASRWARLGASMIDGIIMCIIFLPLLALTLAFTMTPVDAQSGGLLTNFSVASSSIVGSIVSAVLGISIYIAINGYLLTKSGQSVGKKLLGIQIVSHDTRELLSFGKVIGIRYVIVALLSQIPLLGGFFGLVNALFIFNAEKRCLHDLMAGSIVIKTRSF